MIQALANVFRIPDLRRRVLITLLLLVVCRVGAQIPTPGVDRVKMAEYYQQRQPGGGATLFELINLFSGGAFHHVTVFALGIMPYISASIIMQLLTAVVPALEKLAKEGGEEGRRKLSQYTRVSSVFLCAFQAIMMARWVESFNAEMPGVITMSSWSFRLMCMLTMTTGTVFLMWVGEQISASGIGNGISLIITVNIISRVPVACRELWRNISLIDPENQTLEPVMLLVLLAMFVVVVGAVILITQGQRKIPVQHAKRIVGRRIYTGQSSYIPLRVNYGGVIPIIFASSILMFPATIGQMTKVRILERVGSLLTPPHLVYNVFYVLLIIFFCYFWTATVFDPMKMANDMKRNGAFVPGIRPGKPTATFFEQTMNRITLSGALFLAAIAVLPEVIATNISGVTYSIASFFGGTSLLIIVGVMLDTMRAMESHLLMRHYDGFLKKGKLRGRY